VLGLLGRRILQQKRKSVAMKKRNAAVARNGSAVVDLPSETNNCFVGCQFTHPLLGSRLL
jgi:hypothetical protein